jgi:hypothetical protein
MMMNKDIIQYSCKWKSRYSPYHNQIVTGSNVCMNLHYNTNFIIYYDFYLPVITRFWAPKKKITKFI